jgi:hypothetical protein
MSVLSIAIDRHNCEEGGRRHLLALQDLRRDLECNPFRDPLGQRTAMAVVPAQSIRELLELIAALDRRVPHVERAGEAAIAGEAAALKTRALRRIEELERDTPAVGFHESKEEI